jgi:DNA-binding NarL/FixJ family response regulator
MTRILIADDSEVVRRGLSLLIQQHEGWDVCGEAADGMEVVERAKQLSPDVVVLDFSMPVMNGIEAAKRIRLERPATGIVLCSMYLDEQLASIARESGITSVLSKSSVRHITNGIEAVLRGESFDEEMEMQSNAGSGH